jgi:hypothetical protein
VIATIYARRSTEQTGIPDERRSVARRIGDPMADIKERRQPQWVGRWPIPSRRSGGCCVMAESRSRGASINLPPWNGTPKEWQEVWALRKGERVCVLPFWTHPLGGEVRLEVDGLWCRGETHRTA